MPPPLTSVETSAALRKKRLAQGLCAECGAPAQPEKPKGRGRPSNGYRCAECRETARLKAAQKRA